MPTAAQPAPAAMSLSAKPFSFTSFTPTPPAPAAPVAPADPVKESLNKVGVTEEEEVKTFKTLLADLKKHQEDNKDGVISLDLFRKIGELKLCQS